MSTSEKETEVEQAVPEGLPLTVEVVETEKGFDSLECEWENLVDRADCTIYQTFEWQRTWWKYFGKNRTLHCLVFKEEGRTVGIFPLFLQRTGIFPFGGVTVLRACGDLESDYLDVIAASGDKLRVLRAFVEYLRTSGLKFDFLEVRDLSEAFETLGMFTEILGAAGFKSYVYMGTVCPQVKLPATWPEFLQRLGGNLRYQLKKKNDRLKKNFRVEFELAGDSDVEVETAVREFAVVHGNRWESLGYLNAFKDDHLMDFHIEVSRKFARRGWLRMLFLNVDGKKVAVNYDFHFKKRIYFYHGNAFADPEIMKYSPGFLLRCAAIEQGIGEGMEVYDMLRGNETYKTNDFKCEPVGNFRLRAVLPGGLRRLKFAVFTFSEVLHRIPIRMRRDYQDFRRYSNADGASVPVLFRFVWSEVKNFGRLLRQTVSNLLPSSGRNK